MAGPSVQTASVGYGIRGGSQWLSGTVNPSATPGLAADIASEYWRINGSSAEQYQKTGSGDTDWSLIFSGGVGTEDGYQNSFMGKDAAGSETPNYSARSAGAGQQIGNTDDLELAIAKIDDKIGANLTPETRTNNPTIGVNEVHQNLSELDQAIGTDAQLGTPAGRTNNPITVNSTVMDKLGLLDDAIGADPTPVSRTNNPLVVNTSVVTKLDVLDAAIGADLSALTRTVGPVSTANAVNANLDALDTVVGADASLTAVSRTTGPVSTANDIYTNLDALDTAVGADLTAQSRTNNPVSNSNSVIANVSEVDQAIGSDADVGTPAGRTNNPIVVNTTVMTKLGKLDDAIGADVSPVSSRSVGPISTANAVNQNVDALDTAIGVDPVPVVRSNNNPISASNAVNANLDALDAAIGADASISAESRTSGPISVSNTVYQNIDALDNAIGPDLTAESRTQNPVANSNDVMTNISQLDKAIGDDADMPLPNTYISQGSNVHANLNSLDTQVKANADAITSITSGVSWYQPSPFCITDDADLRVAGDGTALSTLLPFSDDEGDQLALADFSFNDLIVSRNNGSTQKVFEVYDSGGSTKAVRVAGVTQLSSGHTFFARHSLVESGAAYEQVCAYRYDGTNVDLFITLDFETADTINTSSGYAAASGNPTAGETIEAMLQKLDGNVDNINSQVGRAQSDTHMGTYTGSIITDNQTVKQNLQELETELELINTPVTGTVSASTPTEVDTIPVTATHRYKWELVVEETATPANAFASDISALCNNSAGTVDTSQDNIDVIPNDATAPTVTYSAAVSGGNLRLTITSDVASSYTIRRIKIK